MPDTTSPYGSLDDQLAAWQARATADQLALTPEERLALAARLHRDDLPADAYADDLAQASGYHLYVTVFAQALVHVATWGLGSGTLPAECAERLWDMASSALSALYALGRRKGVALPPAFSEE